jgi:hypothetical protein
MAPTSSLLLAAVAVAAAIREASAATVYGVQPTRGSLAGGTYLTVWGTGFARSGREGKTRV